MSVQPAARDAARDWQVCTAVVRGAAHELTGLPLQDAAGSRAIRGGLALAVADGHGSRRHFRSARGAELAIEAGLAMAAELAPRLAASQQAAGLTAAARAELVPALLRRWQQTVQDDLAERPPTADELRAGSPPLGAERRTGGSGGSSPRASAAGGSGGSAPRGSTVPYGSTLLLAVLARPWLLLGQIGDGDIVAVGPDGTATMPVPGDPRLDGQRTTSL